MSPVRGLRSIRPTVYIPTDSNFVGKIVIIANDSTEYTVFDSYDGGSDSNYTLSASVNRVNTERLGSFRIRLINDGGRWLNKFDGGEVINFYADSTDATTRIFRGRIDNVNYGVSIQDGFYIDIDGRDKPEMIDKTITGTNAAANADVALAGILYNFYSDVTLTFWNGSAWAEATYNSGSDTVTWSPTISTFPTDAINMSYQHKKGWNVIKEICKRAGLDCYMEYDGSKWTLRTFLQETIENNNESVSYGVNLLNMGEYGKDNNEIINRVIVYGKTESDNILLLKTENNTASQDGLWIKDRVFTETSLEIMDEVQDKADFELSEGINTDSNGRIKSLLLVSAKPGEMINVSVPYTNANGLHKIHELTHTFGFPLTTSLVLTKKINTIKDLFIQKVDSEQFTSQSNPNNMENSYTVYFNENPSKVSHTNTEEISGQLRLQSGQISGTVTSDTITTDSNVTQCEFRRYENFSTGLDTYEVSNTDGSTWEAYSTTAGAVHTFDVADNRLKFRMSLQRVASTDPTPAYESVSLLYK